MERREVADSLQDLGSGIGSAATERLAQGAGCGVLVKTREAKIGDFDVVLIIQQQVLAL